MVRQVIAREAPIEIGGETISAWEARKPEFRTLGRWSDPRALLLRIHQMEHPEEYETEAQGRRWQNTWRGRFSPQRGPHRRKAA